MFGFTKKNSINDDKNSIDSSTSPVENLSYLKKITNFFQKKTGDSSSKSPSLKTLKSLTSMNTIKEIQSANLKNENKSKQNIKEIPEETPIEVAVQSKVIFEEAEEREDEFDHEIFDEKNVFENKLLRYQYYEHLKAVLNATDENERINLLDLDSEEEDILKKEFELEGLAEYEKEYQKLSNELNINQGSLYTEKKNAFEMIKMYSDPYPFLQLRKKFLFILR